MNATADNNVTTIHIEHIHIPFDVDFLQRWKAGDPEIVPAHVLAWKGPGRQNGYGSGEFWAAGYFREQGFNVIQGYNLAAKQSKFRENNTIIRNRLGESSVHRFSDEVRRWELAGLRIASDLDLFVFNTDEAIFIDAKKGQDFLKPNQLRFMVLAQNILGVPSKVAEMDEQSVAPFTTLHAYSVKCIPV
jgi:hypothetical protein